jgi:hypothetical protein
MRSLKDDGQAAFAVDKVTMSPTVAAAQQTPWLFQIINAP